MPAGSRLSNHRNSRGNMASDVAHVGSATVTPLNPNLAAKISAAVSAASVFPSPVGASISNRLGPVTCLAISMAVFWTGRADAPSGSAKLAANSSWLSSGSAGCHLWGK